MTAETEQCDLPTPIMGKNLPPPPPGQFVAAEQLQYESETTMLH